MAIYISSSCTIIGDVTIRNGSSIWHGSILRGDLDSIKIGRNTNIQDNSVVHLDSGFPTLVGDRVTVGHMTILHGCKVGNNCIIGVGSVIGNAAVINDYSIVAPGAIIPEGSRYPEGSIIAGVPAKKVRNLDMRLKGRIEASWRIYVELAKKSLPSHQELLGDRTKLVVIEHAGEIAKVIKRARSER